MQLIDKENILLLKILGGSKIYFKFKAIDLKICVCTWFKKNWSNKTFSLYFCQNVSAHQQYKNLVRNYFAVHALCNVKVARSKLLA